jgi:hypothetical protein
MQTPIISYNVTVIKKVPYLTELLLFLLIPGILVILLAYLFLVSSGESSNEMQIVAVIKMIPSNIGITFLSLILSTIIIWPLYKYVKIYKTATLSFNDEFLFIQGGNIKQKISLTAISKIYFKESLNYRGLPKEELIIYIQEKFMKTTTLKLKDYYIAEQLITDLSSIDNISPLLTGASSAFHIDAED